MDTKQKIIEASVRVFTEYGYLGSSTKAIAEEAGVAEMTLFRKFSTKQNLFDSMLKYKLGNELSESTNIDIKLPLPIFTEKLLHSRMLLISKHIKLVQMILQETLQGRLSNELNFLDVMSTKIKKIFEHYFIYHKLDNQTSLPKMILGIVLHYVILESDIKYHTLSKEQQNEYLTELLSTIKLDIN